MTDTLSDLPPGWLSQLVVTVVFTATASGRRDTGWMLLCGQALGNPFSMCERFSVTTTMMTVGYIAYTEQLTSGGSGNSIAVLCTCTHYEGYQGAVHDDIEHIPKAVVARFP